MLTDNSFLFLAGIGFLAGFIDSIAGGGGLITVPALLSIGMPPHLTLGTNKLAATLGAFNSARLFIQRNIFIPSLWTACMIASAIGALVGVIINYFLPVYFLKQFLLLFIIGAAVFIGFYSPNQKKLFEKKNIFFKPSIIPSSILGFILGGYDGCLGPGTGSFWTCLVMAIYKLDLLSASGVARVMNFISNLIALITFMLLQSINYKIGLVMGIGMFSGSYIGAQSAIHFGAKFIKPLFLMVVISMAIKILLKDYFEAF